MGDAAPGSEEAEVGAAAAALAAAELLLVTAGAGFSADSGLPVYADVAQHEAYARRGLEYADLCRPGLLPEDPRLFYGFWGDCLASYRRTACHPGYEILEKWFASRPPESCCVYTSNVDGHFRRWPRLGANMHEIHGCLEEWMCSCSMAPRREPGPPWASGVAAAPRSCPLLGVRTALPPGFDFRVDPATMLAELGDEEPGPLRCAACAAPLRPAVLLFGDDDASLCSWLRERGDAYQAWEETFEQRAAKGARAAILELGCGTRVPSVRIESEDVLRDTLGRGGNCTLVRVNPELREGPGELAAHTVCIRDTALSALRRIDAAMQGHGSELQATEAAPEPAPRQPAAAPPTPPAAGAGSLMAAPPSATAPRRLAAAAPRAEAAEPRRIRPGLEGVLRAHGFADAAAARERGRAARAAAVPPA